MIDVFLQSRFDKINLICRKKAIIQHITSN